MLENSKQIESLGGAFAELRRIAAEENYALPMVPRTTRKNAFVEMLLEESGDADASHGDS